MAVKLRLKRGGSKQRPFYRIVAADARSPRDGRFIDSIGTYNPIPAEYELDFDEMEAVITKALEAAKAEGIKGKATTPFLLKHIKEYTGGTALASNLQLAYNNARVAAKIAAEYAAL